MEWEQCTLQCPRINKLIRLLLVCFSILFAGFISVACVQVADTKDHSSLARKIADFSGYENGRVLRLGIDKCQKNVCQIVLQLINKGVVLKQQPLEWHTGSTVVSEVPVSAGFGAGDPLDTETQYRSWTIGESENDFVVVTVQPVALEGDIQGMLIHQTAGFEHMHRHHILFLVQNNQLWRVWERTEGQGPTWSSILVGSTESAELIYFEGFAYGDNETGDSLTVQYLTFDGKSSKPQSRVQGKTPLYYVTLAPFRNIVEARDFQQNQVSCLGSSYLLLESNELRIKEKPTSPLILTAITHSQNLARIYQDKLASCLPKNIGKTVKVYPYQ